MKIRYVSIFAILLVLLSGIPLIPGGTMNYANAKYAPNTQSQANTNECNTGTDCAINSPQTQGEGTANSPTNLQMSNFNEEQQVGEEPSQDLHQAYVLVTKIVKCPSGFQCPGPAQFHVKLVAFAPPGGVDISIISQISLSTAFLLKFSATEAFYVVEEDTPPTPAGLILVRQPGG